nr:immunoglobulin heavy chain junction region [Mus musculus]
LLCKRSTTYGL